MGGSKLLLAAGLLLAPPGPWPWGDAAAERRTASAARLGRRRATGQPASPWESLEGTALHLYLNEEQPCECVSSNLPVSGKGEERYIEAPSDEKEPRRLPADYGARCRAWEAETDPECKAKYPPAYCLEKWCYVDKRCKAKDVKRSLVFPEHEELYFSYQNCGSLDAYTAMACMEKREAKCKEPCGWNGDHGCQNDLCKCTGDNSIFSKRDRAFYGEDYGKMCASWDDGTCSNWQGKAELGLWCCKQWCYVDKGCPSAKVSAVNPHLYYSYHACPDEVHEMLQCPYKEPIDFQGNPLPLSPKASKALSKSKANGRRAPAVLLVGTAVAAAAAAAAAGKSAVA